MDPIKCGALIRRLRSSDPKAREVALASLRAVLDAYHPQQEGASL